MFTKEGISTTFLAMNEPRRTAAGGTARNPPARKSAAPKSANLAGTLS